MIPSSIRYISIAHAHDDHAGFLTKLTKANTEAKVIVQERTAPLLVTGMNNKYNGGGLFNRQTLSKIGHACIMLNSEATRHGAVETPLEWRLYATFLAENNGKFEGIILCLPNFGDETGAIAALEDCGVPILIQAHPASKIFARHIDYFDRLC